MRGLGLRANKSEGYSSRVQKRLTSSESRACSGQQGCGGLSAGSGGGASRHESLQEDRGHPQRRLEDCSRMSVLMVTGCLEWSGGGGRSPHSPGNRRGILPAGQLVMMFKTTSSRMQHPKMLLSFTPGMGGRVWINPFQTCFHRKLPPFRKWGLVIIHPQIP